MVASTSLTLFLARSVRSVASASMALLARCSFCCSSCLRSVASTAPALLRFSQLGCFDLAAQVSQEPVRERSLIAFAFAKATR